MRKRWFAAIFALVSLIASSAYAYEFHLLNGHGVITGDIIAFRNGLFKVGTGDGVMIVEASKVDYIKLEDKDRTRPITCSGFEMTDENPNNWPPESPQIPEAAAAPSPLEHHSLLPHPFSSWSATLGRGQKTLQKGFKGGQ